MSYTPGRYVIIKRAYWTHEMAKTITIVDIDFENSDVCYYYEGRENIIRRRGFSEFEDVELVPTSPLMEELL